MVKVKSRDGVKVLTALLTSLPEKQAELGQALEGLRLAVGQEAGCLDCVVGHEVPGGNRFVLLMVWKNLEALEAHMASDDFRILRGAMNVLSEPAEFRLVEADEAGGGFAS